MNYLSGGLSSNHCLYILRWVGIACWLLSFCGVLHVKRALQRSSPSVATRLGGKRGQMGRVACTLPSPPPSEERHVAMMAI
mmetsp:Transcript_18933/g.52100  ORF Transcript_18933/g.52100 Transcript_18933/m.52100 type:complete len:81 (-) Transcript_18933:11-253(-)